MSTLTYKITKLEFNKIDSLYKSFKTKDLKNENLLALYKTKDLTISIFKNLTLLLQGTDEAIKNFNNKETKVSSKNSKKKVDGIIGMDEVGTGDYFGPVVTCACYIDNKNIEKIKDLKVNDSKKINDKQIKLISKKLKKITISETCICAPNVYNKIIDKYNNSNIVKAICHNESLTKLTTKLRNIKYQIVLDQFVSQDNYYSYLKSAKRKAINIDVFETKAESKYLAVACASIIARDAFLTYMNELSKKIKIVLPLGAVEKNKIILVGKQIIKKDKLNNYAKLHFDSITKEILSK